MNGTMVTDTAVATNAAMQSQSLILPSGTSGPSIVTPSFNLAEPLLRLAELEVRIGVRPFLLLLAVLGSRLRLQMQVWVDPRADCQFDAG